MFAVQLLRSVTCMQTTSEFSVNKRPAVSWLLILGLGALALLQGLGRHLGLSNLLGAGTAAFLLIAVVTVAWISVVGWGRVPRPILTLTLTGLTASFYVIVLSAVLSPVLTGALQGPLAYPIAIIPVVIIHTGWGFLALHR